MKYPMLNRNALSKGMTMWIKSRDEYVMATAISIYREMYSLEETVSHFDVFKFDKARIRKYQRHYDYIMNAEDFEMMKFLNYHKMLYAHLRKNGYTDKDQLLKEIIKNTCSFLDMRDVGIGKVEFLLICAKNDGIDINIEERLEMVSNFKKVRVSDRLTKEDLTNLRNDATYIRKFKIEDQICRALEVNPLCCLFIDDLFISTRVYVGIMAARKKLADVELGKTLTIW